MGIKKTNKEVSMNLMDAQKQHNKYPDTFWIPDLNDRKSMKIGTICQLVFLGQKHSERMWVIITEVDNDNEDIKYTGTLDNDPIYIRYIKCGDEVKFEPKHVIKIYE
jgi:hypothetical protein